MEALVAGLTACAVSLASPLLVVPLLRRHGIIDVPDHRSSHTLPIVRGAGMAVALGVLAGWGVAAAADLAGAPVATVFGAALLVSCVGLVEDLHGLSIPTRLIGQLAVGVGVGVACGVASDAWWSMPVAALGFAGYVNAANFMDGVDSISALHGAVTGGYFCLLGGLEQAPGLQVVGAVCVAVFVGFLPWNLAPTLRVFLGDVGSYLLGGLVAGAAVLAIVDGVGVLLAVAPLLAYLADTTFTLAVRVARGEPFTESHRCHVYQRLASGGWTHLVSGAVVAVVTALCCLVAVLASWAVISTAAAIGCTAILLGAYLALPRVVAAGRSTRRVTI